MLIPVILSGGAGTRLWPLSRELYPKQFLALVGERTMIQETALRSIGLPDVTNPIVVCNEAHRFLVAEQLRQVGIEPRSILLEPAGRNTAPAVAIAALMATRDQGGNDEPLLLVLPADHVLGDTAAFQRAVEAAIPAARERPLCDLRRHTDPRRDRLWLHPPGRRDRDRGRAAGRGFRGKAGRQARRGIPRKRRVSLEQRHVPAAGQGLSRRACEARPGRCWPPAAMRLDAADQRPRFRAPGPRRLSNPAVPIRSTMR